VLFADIRGFTAMAEQLAPTEVVGVLNGYLTAATDVIFAHRGTIDKFIGDAIMALFGAPVALPDHPLLAVTAALALQRALDALPPTRGRRVSFGVGVNTGVGVVGTIGAPRLLSYTAIGDVVNVAARLQGEARAGEVLIAEDTYRRVADAVDVEPLGSTYVKGRVAPVQTYKVRGLRGAPHANWVG
jgi:adenylate cyclase